MTTTSGVRKEAESLPEVVSTLTNRNVLSLRTRLAYSVGHFLNDLCASIWFSYTLLFFKLDFDKTTVGSLLLLGQVADALSTPLVGYLSDRGSSSSSSSGGGGSNNKGRRNWTLVCNYGRRKSWHLIGTILILISFPFIYNECFLCDQQSTLLAIQSSSLQVPKVAYYALLIVIFQFGWAAVQVTHVSLITDLTPLSSERVELNAYRQASTVAANVIVYSITLVLIETKADKNGIFTRNDAWIFGVVAVTVCIIGTIFSILFHTLVKEPRRPVVDTISDDDDDQVESPKEPLETASLQTLDTSNTPKVIFISKSENIQAALRQQTLTLNPDEKTKSNEMVVKKTKYDHKASVVRRQDSTKSCKDWLQSVSFWKIGLIYMMSRLYFNLSQVYTPMYLQSSLLMNKNSIAVIPFVTYSTGFAFSLLAKPISIRTGSKFVLLIGCVLGLVSSGWIYFGSETDPLFVRYQVYFATAFNGLGSTAILISSLALTADLVGTNTETGAFVFGAMSFLDKLINGAAVFIIEQINPNSSAHTNTNGPVRQMFYKHVLVFVAGGGVLFTLLGLVLIRNSNLGLPSEKEKQEKAIQA